MKKGTLVCIADEGTYHFYVPLDKEAKWNSLCDLGDNVVAALSSTNFNSDRIGVWMIKGEIKNSK